MGQLEGVPKRRHRLRAVLRVAAQRAPQRLLELDVLELGHELADAARPFAVAMAKRVLVGQQLEQHHGDGEDIGAGVRRHEGLAQQLGRHVLRVAELHPGGCGHPRSRRLGEALGMPGVERVLQTADPEVDDLDQPVGLDHHVRGGEIAVDDAEVMCDLEGPANLQPDLHYRECVHPPDPGPEVPQVLAPQVLHDDEQLTIRRLVAVMDPNNVLMLNAGQHEPFTQETLLAVDPQVQFRVQHLDGQVAAQSQVVREVHFAHASLADELPQLDAAGEHPRRGPGLRHQIGGIWVVVVEGVVRVQLAAFNVLKLVVVLHSGPPHGTRFAPGQGSSFPKRHKIGAIFCRHAGPRLRRRVRRGPDDVAVHPARRGRGARRVGRSMTPSAERGLRVRMSPESNATRTTCASTTTIAARLRMVRSPSATMMVAGPARSCAAGMMRGVVMRPPRHPSTR